MENNCYRTKFHHLLYTCTVIHAFAFALAGGVEIWDFLFYFFCDGLVDAQLYLSLKVLDACSAPGNKTVHLAALLRGKGKITACELNKERVNRLKETISLSGASSILLIIFLIFKCHFILFYLLETSFLFHDCWRSTVYLLLCLLMILVIHL